MTAEILMVGYDAICTSYLLRLKEYVCTETTELSAVELSLCFFFSLLRFPHQSTFLYWSLVFNSSHTKFNSDNHVTAVSNYKHSGFFDRIMIDRRRWRGGVTSRW